MRSVFASVAVFSIACLPVFHASSARATNWDNFSRECTPKADKSHDCLAPLPTYSYHLALPSHYQQAICLSLGTWTGENDIIVEWDGLQARHTIQGQTTQQQQIQPALRQGLSSGVIVYSQQRIFPVLVQGNCPGGQPSSAVAITQLQWPAAAEDSVSSLRDQLAKDGLTGFSTPQLSVVSNP